MDTSMNDLSRLCLHTITTKPWSLEEAVEQYCAAGVSGISVWRNVFNKIEPAKAGELLEKSGLSVVSLVRGGFFCSVTPNHRQTAIDDNLKALDEAAAVGAPMLVLVCGADPKQSLEVSRQQIQEGIETILPRAKELQINLAIEPLHPMYADDRSAINTLKQANDMCAAIGDASVGVAVDVYHLWWDPDLQQEITRCGKEERLFAFHVCDWKTPTEDLLNDRGLMGEGCIPIRQIRGWVEEAGFNGFIEVEIFSSRWWSQDQKVFLEEIKRAYVENV
jgi:sugar phosphate isomerase/epimerase